MSTEPPSAFGNAPTEQSKMQEVTDQTREKTQELAGQAKDQAQQAAGQARNMLREQLDQRSSQAAQQISTQASDLRSVSDALREQGKEGPANAAGKLAEYAERAGGYLRDRDSDGLLADAEDLGRRQPWAVAAGGIFLGFAAARFLKASSSRRYASRQGSAGDGRWPADGTSPSPVATPFSSRVPGAAPPAPSRIPAAADQPQAPGDGTSVRTTGL